MYDERRHRNIRQFLLSKKTVLNNRVINIKELDFAHDGEFSDDEYEILKAKTKYINPNSEIVLKVPRRFIKEFTEKLEYFVALEVLFLNQEIKNIKKKALLLFSIGIIIFGCYRILMNVTMLSEFTIVMFWVFSWTSAELVFFDLPNLRKREKRLLQLVSAKIVDAKKK